MTTDEEARLRAVERLGLFGTPPEERFDRITRLACDLFDVSSAAVTVIGRDVQWNKATTGFDVASVPRDRAFCEHSIRTNGLVVVEDLTRDARFAESPSVTGEPHLRFLAALPIASTDGQPVGTLCLLDSRPRVLTAAELGTLAELGRWAQAEFNQSVELDRAAEIQRGLMPDRAGLRVPGHQLATLYVPSSTVGGDLVDYYLTPDGRLIVTIGDVTGKGVGAAIMVATVRAAMRTTTRRLPPAEAVTEAAATMEADLQRTGTTVSLCHASIDLSDGEIQFVDAGHGLCVKVGDEATAASTPEPGGLPLGVQPDERWTSTTGRLCPGETLVAFSDGLLDLYPDIESAFEEIERVVRKAPDAAAVVAHFDAVARSHPLDDDVTMVVLHKE